MASGRTKEDYNTFKRKSREIFIVSLWFVFTQCRYYYQRCVGSPKSYIRIYGLFRSRSANKDTDFAVRSRISTCARPWSYKIFQRDRKHLQSSFVTNKKVITLWNCSWNTISWILIVSYFINVQFQVTSF